MKHLKKIVSLLLTAVMVLAMCIPVMADTASNSIISVKAGDKHTYNVYQIFTGNLSDGKLTEVKWGKNAKDADKVNTSVDETILKKLESLTGSDASKLETISLYVNLKSEKFATVSAGKPVEVQDGYYLIKDANSLAGTEDATTMYIVKVAGNVEIERKVAQPTVDKQVEDQIGEEKADENVSSDPSADGWGETADHAINESFKFKLKATLPADTDFAAYKKYTVKFKDTMSEGVTYEGIDSVYVGTKKLETNDYKIAGVKPGDAGATWTLTIDNLKDYVEKLETGVEVTVIYNAHLNEKAQVNHESGDTTNNNKVSLEYSNNPNVGGEGELGKTPDDFVWVFTYEVDNTKYDATDENNPKPLKNAGFRLYKEDGKTEIRLIYDSSMAAYRPVKADETAVEMKSASDGKFNIKGLDAGKYVLKETTVPDGFNKCEDVNIIVKASHYEIPEGTSSYTMISSDSTMTNAVNNKSGSTLPSTGGIGTTIFYVVGVILMLGAGVLLVTKKRMSSNR